MTPTEPNYPLCYGLKYEERSNICHHCKYRDGCAKSYRPPKRR